MKNQPRVTYHSNTVQFKRKDNPDAWAKEEDYNGEMFSGYPSYSFIPGTQGDKEPTRYGDFVIDIDTKEIACNSALQVVDWFRAIYGVDPEQWRIYLSGKKGVHLELPAEVLGTEDGHTWLTLGYKRLALDIEAALSVELDTSIYNKGTGKPFRRPNVMRDIGTCKRQIDHGDLYEITDNEEYQEACKEPGKTWEPEEVSKNPQLAQKIKAFLKESDKQQEAIKLAPELSNDERDRLINEIPACMKMLAHLTEWTNGNTFNDIAIQVTAYAVTAGMSENDFLAGCAPFIESYPSSSLTTPEKRYENCRARYRTMRANGNAHSCGGVLALKVPGFDCSTCNCKTAGPRVTVEVMSVEEATDDNISLNIPESVLNPGGLISLGMEALRAPGMVNIDQYNMAAVLTCLANAAAGKLTCLGVWPNLYNIRVGVTSTGKTSSDRALREAINNVGLVNFYGVTDFASGPALMRSLAANPIQMITIDECSNIFRRQKGGDPNSDGKRDALLEAYSASGGEINKVYADSKNSIIIKSPCLTLTGNATTTIFDSIEQVDFDTGTMQRFDFFCYDGLIPQRDIASTAENINLRLFAEGIAKVRDAKPESGGNLVGMGAGFAPAKLELTPDAIAMLREWSRTIVDRANAVESEGDKGIISRAYDLALKYAIVHIVGTREPHEIFFPMDVQDLEYGKSIAWLLCQWKIEILRPKITTGDFHKMQEILKDSIKACLRNKRRPTMALMHDKRVHLKNFPRRMIDDVVFVLQKRGEIIIDESTATTAYFLPSG